MAAPYILARTMGEAHRFAQEVLELKRGYYRVVTSPGSIKGPVGADLHLVPGWEGRFDRFSMKGALRWTRLTVVDHTQEPVEVPEPESTLSPEDIAELEVRLEPEGWEPPAELSAEQVLRLAAGETGAEVAPIETVPDELEPAGEQTVIPVPEQPEPTPEAEDTTPVEDEPKAEEPKRRRRRCPECGELVEPDALEQHKAEHLPEEV